MKTLLVLAAAMLAGCADASHPNIAVAASSPYIKPAPDADNPPVTMSGYVDTSYTKDSH